MSDWMDIEEAGIVSSSVSNGWYTLPDGSKVRGYDAAAAAAHQIVKDVCPCLCHKEGHS